MKNHAYLQWKLSNEIIIEGTNIDTHEPEMAL